MANICTKKSDSFFFYWCKRNIDGELVNGSSCAGWHDCIGLSNCE